MNINLNIFPNKCIPEKEVIAFTRQLSLMINSAIPLVQAIQITSNQQHNKKFKTILIKVLQDLKNGTPFSRALQRHPTAFNLFYCKMVAAGEFAGVINLIIDRLALHKEKSYYIKKKVINCLTYPIICLLVSFIIIIVIMTYVVPVFSQMFSGTNSPLPLATLITIRVSNFIINNLSILLLCIFSIFVALKQSIKIKRVRLFFDKLILNLPILGNLLKNFEISRFSHSMLTLTASGISIYDSINITAQTTNNKIIAVELYKTATNLTNGISLANSLKLSSIFPLTFVQMIHVGESSGTLSKVLKNLSSYHENEANHMLDKLTSLIEPAMIIILGLLIGSIVVSMYLPIFQMGSAL